MWGVIVRAIRLLLLFAFVCSLRSFNGVRSGQDNVIIRSLWSRLGSFRVFFLACAGYNFAAMVIHAASRPRVSFFHLAVPQTFSSGGGWECGASLPPLVFVLITVSLLFHPSLEFVS